MEWVLLVAAIALVATVAPGYLILRMFSFLGDTRPLQALIYSVGVSLVVLPLAIYWGNFFGLPITLDGVVIVLVLVLSFATLGNIAATLTRRLRGHNRDASRTRSKVD